MIKYTSLVILIVGTSIPGAYAQQGAMQELEFDVSPKEAEIARRRSQKSQPGFLKKEPIWPREQPKKNTIGMLEHPASARARK